jgi:ABC-type Fe3+/spermidine/putrescine transport system ATPase subunit
VSTALRLEEVTLAYGGRKALDALSLSVAPGDVLALLGPSASGKTSVLRALLGFSVPQSGTVTVGDQTVSREGRNLVAPEDRGLAVVFQDLALWPHLTVAGNLAFGLAARGVPVAAAKERIAAMLRRVGLAGTEERHPGELSGGQRQRVAIARALVLDPRAVLLDEPLSNVDVDLRRELLGLLRDLWREKGSTVIHVTHDLREAVAVANRFVVMEAGTIVQRGALEDLRRAPATPFVGSLLDDLDGGAPRTDLDEGEPAKRSV